MTTERMRGTVLRALSDGVVFMRITNIPTNDKRGGILDMGVNITDGD